MRAADEGLVERDAELDALAGVLAAGSSRSPAIAVIAGPPGIGKTRLLDVLVERASSAHGYSVLRAQAAELERDLAWDVVRQLFSPVLREPVDASTGGLFAGAASLALGVLGLERRGPSGADGLSARLHGLYWLTANLAERRPVVIAVDDLQWADPASGRFVDYLARRLADLPVVMAVTVRSGDLGARERTSVLRAIPEAVVVEPRALSVAGSARLLAALMPRRPEEEFAGACHAATGGNPYLLGELGAQLVRDGIEPLDSEAAHVRSVTPRSVSHSVLLRLSRLPDDARRLAEAVAVLGASVALPHAAALAGLDEARAAELADALAGADVLLPGAPLEFAHPLVRSAVYGETPSLARAAAHARAARLLAEAGAGLDVVATQLLQTQPAGDAWVVRTLATAAASARERGAPKEAARWLRRALEEPPALGARTGLLLQLGTVELATDEPSAIEHLESARELSSDPVERAHAAVVLAGALVYAHRPLEAFDLTGRALAELAGRDRELELQLEATRLMLVWYEGRAAVDQRRPGGGFNPDMRGDTLGERLLLAAVGCDAALSEREPARTAVELIARGVADGRLLDEVGPESIGFWQAVFMLQAADAFDLSDRCLRMATERVRRDGSVTGMAIAATFRARQSLLLGSLAEAKAEADQAFELHERAGGWRQGRGPILHTRLETLIEQGRLDDAEIEAARLDALEGSPTSIDRLFAFCSRGLLHVIRGRFEAALSDLLYVGESTTTSLASVLPWRSRAAAALSGLGRRDEADALLRDDARSASAFGTARLVGASLRARAALAGGDEAIELLRESVAVLEHCPSPLERAHSLVALGSALRRRSRRAEAVPALREGLDLAERCGAEPLAARARRELADAGARPHRPARFGRDQLTPSELRVARMAAGGASNKQIAQALFVSLRTVETHLTHAYAKLGVGARAELGTALAARFPPAEERRIA